MKVAEPRRVRDSEEAACNTFATCSALPEPKSPEEAIFEEEAKTRADGQRSLGAEGRVSVGLGLTLIILARKKDLPV